jgi:hypothetical protein
MPKHTETQPSKQSTLDRLPNARPKDAIEIIKQPPEEEINITQIMAQPKEDDELALKIAFRLPTRKSFSRLKADLWFDREPCGSVLIRVLQGPLTTAESEFGMVLDMRGIAAGRHIVGVEMYGLWGENEKHCKTIRETTVDYVPVTRQARLVRVPSVRSVAGADLAVVSSSEKGLYKEIEQTIKKEHASKRDNW